MDELSEEVLKILYRQSKLMTFAGMPEKRLKQLVSRGETETEEDKASESTSQLLYELEGVNWDAVLGNGEDDAENTDKAPRHADTRLQTAMTEERLFLQLLKIQAEAVEFHSRVGRQCAVLALGFLHWFEGRAVRTSGALSCAGTSAWRIRRLSSGSTAVMTWCKTCH